MAEEKIFIINLRREFLKKPHYKRAKKAVKAVREFISRHLKVNEVNIGKYLNHKILERGTSNPPSKIKVKAFVEEKIAYVELPEFEFNIPKPKEDVKKPAEESKKEHKHHAHSPKEEEAKESEKELIKESKKEHKQEIIEKPGKEVKEQEKVKDSLQRETKVIGRTGKKGAKEAKP